MNPSLHAPHHAPLDAAPALSATDRAYLGRALELARTGWGWVHPNPMVGCVLVRDEAVVGEGGHEVFGGPHAEIRALEHAGEAARGATAYVTLEPCRHQGKTPACTTALVQSGVARVIYGAPDEGEASGGGAAVLAAAGVDVLGPVFSSATSWRANPAFHHAQRTHTPFVAVKLALSLDARLAEGPGRRTDLTGAEARREVHRLRAGHDAVMVGGTTARVDDPLLTVREDVSLRQQPVRMILDGRAALPSDAALFRDLERAPVWVFVRDSTPEAELERLEAAGAVVHPVPVGPGGVGVDLDAVLSVAWTAGVRAIFCEGGAHVASSLLSSARAQRLYVLLAPRQLGPDGVPAFPDGGMLETSWSLAEPPRAFGDDTLLVLDRPGVMDDVAASGASGTGAP